MARAPAKPERGGTFPPSPCVRICELDERSNCTGCRRTMDEISRWSAMSAAEQWRVVEELPNRRA